MYNFSLSKNKCHSFIIYKLVWMIREATESFKYYAWMITEFQWIKWVTNLMIIWILKMREGRDVNNAFQ